MTHPVRFRFTRGMAIRMLADAVVVAFSLALAVGGRLLYLIGYEIKPGEDIAEYIRRDTTSFWNIVPWIVVTCIAMFFLSGFYTYGKHYLSKYKILIIAQAVSLSYLLVGFAAFFFTGASPVARSAWPAGCLMTILTMIGTRVWSTIWKRHVAPERETLIREKHGIQRVLVIGGGGYIGSALLPLLLSSGYKVRLLDILLFGEDPISEFADHPNLEIVVGNFCELGTVRRAMDGCDAVIHLGGIVGDPACSFDEDLTLEVNLVSTRMIAELARLAKISRLIFASTCSVYGAHDELLDERSRVEPVSLYGQTKQASETLLRNMAGPDFAPTILRFATIYGFSGRTRFDLVINLMTAKAKLEGEIQVHGGDQWRPFVHVVDAARAIHACLKAPLESVSNQIFNVGSDEQNHTITQIAEMVADRVVGTQVTIEEANTDPRNYRVSFRKIHRMLGFTTEWSIDDGIQQVLEAIASGQVIDYTDPRYSNVKSLELDGRGRLKKEDWARQLIDELSED